MLQVEMNINNMTIRMPHQLFINGEFVDAEGGKTYKTINPTTTEVEYEAVLWFLHNTQCPSPAFSLISGLVATV